MLCDKMNLAIRKDRATFKATKGGGVCGAHLPQAYRQCAIEVMMALLQWHKIYKFNEGELQRPPCGGLKGRAES